MNEIALNGLAEAGRTISIYLMVAIYIIIWVITYKYGDDNSKIEKFSIFWICIHCLAF